MSIIQAVIASIPSGSAPPPPPPPYYGTDFNFEPELGPQLGSNGWWTWSGSITAPMSFSSNPPTRDAYTYPDGSAEHVYTFNGTDNYMVSPQLSTTGAWPDLSITVDMWFYPTATGVTLLAQLGSQAVNDNYNFNMLEINSSGNVLLNIYNGNQTPTITSPNTVMLNAWNHVYLLHDVQNGVRLELNGNLDGTHAVNATHGYAPDTLRYFSWGTGGNGSNMGNTAYFQGKIGTVHIYDTIQSSTYNATKIKHAVPELLLNIDASNPASYSAQYTATVNTVENSGTELHIPKAFSATLGTDISVGYPLVTQWGGGYNATVTNIGSGTGGIGPEWIITVSGNVAPGFAGGDSVTFGTGGATWANLVSGGHDVTLMNTPTFNSSGVKSFTFGVNGSYAQTSGDIWFNQDFTVVAWVKLNSYANWERIIDFGNGAGVNTVLLAASNGVSGQPAMRTENTQFAASSQIPLNTWTQVVGRLKADGNASIFINGTNVMNYSNMSIPGNVSRSNCYIGKSNWPDALLDGSIGELQIYHSAVSDATITANYNSTINKYYDLSLVFNHPQGDYLSTPASADWNLGTTWTIEFWMKANSSANGSTHMTSGIWGLLNQGGWSTTNSINIALSDSKLVVGQGGQYADVRFTEPPIGGVPSTLFNVNSQGGWNGGGAWTNLSTTGGTGSGLTVSVAGVGGGYVNAVAIVNPGSGYTSGDVITATGESSFSFTIGSCTPVGVWTHVAIANDAGTQRVFYNGVEQTKVSGTYSTASYTNSTDSLAIGAMGDNSSHFDGKMALVRISNTAKYSTAFTPTTTYGVEADTKMFLGLDTPLVDSMSHTITNSGVSLSTDVPVPLSLQFVQSQTDYLDVAASTDWALNRTWTIEWWSKASKVSTEGDLLTVMCQDYTDGNSIQIIYQAGTFEIQGTNRIAAEPTPGVWTHVALVNTVADGMTLYYNGVSQYTGGYWSLANNTAAIRIGARGLADFQRFDGQLALIRISNTAKYTGTFTPTKSYGVESDTKLFLGKYAPLVDAKGHAVTNHGVTTNTDFPT